MDDTALEYAWVIVPSTLSPLAVENVWFAIAAIASATVLFPEPPSPAVSEAVLSPGSSDRVPAEVPDAVLTAQQLRQVQDSGAAFGISPGITPVLAKAAANSGLPYFPGVGGASDLLLALEHGFNIVKLFPSDIVGSTKMAKALGGPFPDVKFCLTGGVTVESTPQLLTQANVLCVGGSWMCPASLIDAKDWAAIGQLAAAAAQAGARK